MFFVIKYDRVAGARILFEEFSDDDFERAQKRRLEVEIGAISECDRVEVVMLEAESLDMLHTTHRRYFEDVHNMAKRISNPTNLPQAEKPNPLKK